jgi:hypothetical protein
MVACPDGIWHSYSAMKMRIGNIEFSDLSHDDVDMLVKRYGKVQPEPQSKHSQKSHADESHNTGSRNGVPTDIVALRRFVEAGTDGVKTTDIGEILGRRGKAARGAIREWSKRIGLTNDADATMDTFEDCRVGTSRGVRIKPNLLEVAKMLLDKHQ